MSFEAQDTIAALRRMVETRDLLIADLEREIKELRADRDAFSLPCDTCGSTLHHSDLCERE